MFTKERRIKSTRKPHRCEQCGTQIEKGSEAAYLSGVYDGNFFAHHEHVECYAAGVDYANATGQWGEDFIYFRHESRDELDAEFFLKFHPIVASRLGLKCQEQPTSGEPDNA